MGWLSVTDEQRNAVDAINAVSSGVRVNLAKGTQGGWLANADALADAVPGGLLEQFAAWYSGLAPTDDVPAPRPPRARR